MKIGNYNLNESIMIIAEIGNNHEGNFSLAEKMIGLAAESGANAVKFQTIIPEKLVSVKETKRIEQLRGFQFSYTEFERLSLIAKNHGLIFLSTPFDIGSAKFLNNCVPAFKIASGDNDFYPLLQVVAETGKPIILSTGLTNLDSLKKSVEYVQSIWDEKGIVQEIALLHCVSAYPTPPQDANLLAINELKNFTRTVGYSDHTLGIDAALLSVALGARIIEKHFTIDKNFSSFWDHQISAEPNDMKNLVELVRKAEIFLGTGEKIIQDSEVDVEEGSRRSIVARYDLPEGTIITMEDLDWLRPGNGLKVGNEELLIGKKINKNIIKSSQINIDDLQ